MFIDLNGATWDPDPPGVDEAEEAMFAVATLDEAYASRAS